MITGSLDRANTYTLIAFTAPPERPAKVAGVEVQGVNLLILGSITVPWPSGITAEQALMEWKRNG